MIPHTNSQLDDEIVKRNERYEYMIFQLKYPFLFSAATLAMCLVSITACIPSLHVPGMNSTLFVVASALYLISLLFMFNQSHLLQLAFALLAHTWFSGIMVYSCVS